MPEFDDWIADRTRNFDSSGIRKMFELAAKLKDPINLSIGQPDFDVPPPIKEALIRAIQEGKNGYAATQGVPVLQGRSRRLRCGCSGRGVDHPWKLNTLFSICKVFDILPVVE